ncbi:MAG: hypothetical protein V3S11_02705 [Elusimicrobiota bacterium]
MLPAALALALAAPALAVEIPPSWRCVKKELGIHWRGEPLIDPKAGPNWGERMGKAAHTPFIWLVIYQHRDRDVAERRAPIDQRWKNFNPHEKCSYFKHYLDEAAAKKAEFDALIGWKNNGKLTKATRKLSPETVMAAQNDELLKSWRKRFDKMQLWLEGYGMKEGDANLEAARGILFNLGRLKVAHLDFRRASGRFEAKVRIKFAEEFAKPEEFRDRLLGLAARKAVALLNEPKELEAVIGDFSEQLAKDPDNEIILGSDFDRRLVLSLEARLYARKQRADIAKVAQTRKKIAARKAALKAAEARVDAIERLLKEEKLMFPGEADPLLLISLEEYRQGRKNLYPIAMKPAGLEELKTAYLNLLKNVCVVHYTSIRYKKKLIGLLCD